MSALDDVVNIPDRFHTPKHYAEARAELAKLRATVAEQARQLAEARDIIATVSLEAFGVSGSNYLRMRNYVRGKCDAWLAANPAPQEDK